ncbi:MAG: hypothetical protein ACP5KB_00015 [Thermoprotei archaeon]
MRKPLILLEVIKRLIILVVFWTLINDLFYSVFSGRLLTNLARIFSLPFSEDVLVSFLVMAASLLALLTLITSNYGLYVATSAAMLLTQVPDISTLSLIIFGLMGLFLTDTYVTSTRHKRSVKVFVKGSRIYYFIVSAIFVVIAFLTTYFTTLYLNLFTSFTSSIPATSTLRVFGLFLGVNPVGRALLILVAIPAFMKLSLSFVDAVAYFIIPNPTLAKSELSSAARFDREIRYPFYTLMSFIFTLYMAPPSYYSLRYLMMEVLPWTSAFIGSIVGGSPYATLLPILAEVLFFFVLWGLLSYVTRFFRGYVNNKLIAVFVFLATFFFAITYFSSLDMNEFLSVVYFRYYRDFLLVGELLLQITGFVP